ncbi:hypothetical protein ISCGN_026963 [Ixodes scapularis]
MFCLPFHTITAGSDSSCIYNYLTREALNYLWLRTPVYEKQGPKWCIASPGGPRRVQTYPGLGSTTRMPFSPDTGKPRTAIRGRANPHGSGSVETPLSKHLLSQDTRLREAGVEAVYCLARGAPKGPNIPRAQLNHQGPLFPGHGYATHSQTWVGEPTWLGVRSDATHQAPTKVGAPCVRVWWPTWLGSVVTLLTKHLAPKVPPAGKTEAVRGQAPKGNGGNGKKKKPEATDVYYVDAAADEELPTAAAGINLRGMGTWAVPLEAETPDDAEAQAVVMAVKLAYAEADKKRQDSEDRKKPTTVMIFTDSQEVLRACKEYRLASPTVGQTMKTAICTSEHHGIRLQIRWVPGHSGVEGNEAAHVAAREHKRFLLSSANGPLKQRAAEISNGYREYNPTAADSFQGPIEGGFSARTHNMGRNVQCPGAPPTTEPNKGGQDLFPLKDTRLREAGAEAVYCLARGAPKGPTYPGLSSTTRVPFSPDTGTPRTAKSGWANPDGSGFAVTPLTKHPPRTPVYRKQGPKWCVASPGGPRRVQTYPGLSSTTRMPFSLDTGSPRTARRGWVLATFFSGSVVSPKWLGSVVTLLTKHLALKVQAPPAELGVRGDATLQTPVFTGTGGSSCCPCRAAGALKSAAKISGETWVALDSEPGAGPLCTTSAKLPFDKKENRFLASGTPVYEKRGPKWCIASPGGPRRVQPCPGLGSTTRMPFSQDTGKPRTVRRGRANPHDSGSVETPLSKHLLSQGPIEGGFCARTHNMRRKVQCPGDPPTTEPNKEDTRLREAGAEAVYCLARGAPKGPNIPRLSSTTRVPFSPDTGTPRTARRGWANPHGSGFVVTPLTKHLLKCPLRGYVLWRGLDKDTEEQVRTCATCQVTRDSPPQAPVHPWKCSPKPWSRLHVDFAGPF